MNNVLEYLDVCRLQKNDTGQNVISVYPIKGKYAVNFDTLFELFTETTDRDKHGIEEVFGTVSPLLIDIDFKHDMTKGKHRRYTRDTVKSIIKLFQTQIKSICQDYINCYNFCIVLEKSKCRIKDDAVKDGIHLHFPHFVQKVTYIKQMIKNVQSQVNAVIDFDVLDTNIVDAEVICEGKGWLMYNGIKDEKLEPYRISVIYDDALNEMTLEDCFLPTLVEFDERGIKIDSVKRHIHRFMSIRREFADMVELKRGDNFIINNINSIRKPVQYINKNPVPSIAVITRLAELRDRNILGMIKPETIEDHNIKMKIGWALHNVGQGCEEALDMWIECCKSASDWIDNGHDKCVTRWNSMKVLESPNEKLLYYYAKRDSPKEYNAMFNDMLTTKIIESLQFKKSPTTLPIARLLHYLYSDRLVCVDTKGFGVWYEFRDHKWNEIDNAITLYTLINDEVISIYSKYLNDTLHSKRFDTDTTKLVNVTKLVDDIKEVSGNTEKVARVIEYVNDVAGKDKLVKECCKLFYNKDFINHLDGNKRLLGLSNGVLDLDTGKVRDGIPTDYISKTTEIEYKHILPTDREMVLLNDFLKKIFVDDDLRRYFIDFMTSCLEGGNKRKNFVIFTGSGNNGKSVTVKVCQRMLGKYCRKMFKEALLVRNIGSPSAPTPDMEDLVGARLAIADEIGEGEILDMAVIKRFTGNDVFASRGMWKSKIRQCEPMFKLVIQVNKIPVPDKIDEAFTLRCLPLPFLSRFTENVGTTIQDQFKSQVFEVDYGIEEQLPELAQALLSLCIDNWNGFKNNNFYINIPNKMQSAKKEYIERADIVLNYIRSRLREAEEGEDSELHISVGLVCADYKKWCTTMGYNQRSILRWDEFKTRLCTRLGNPKKVKTRLTWIGWMFKDEVD